MSRPTHTYGPGYFDERPGTFSYFDERPGTFGDDDGDDCVGNDDDADAASCAPSTSDVPPDPYRGAGLVDRILIDHARRSR